MPSTYSAIYFHIVFGTHDRVPMIEDHWRSRLHEYMGGTLKGFEVQPLAIDGARDHVHLLVRFKPTHNSSKVVQDLKTATTRWIKSELGLRQFAWQTGFAAISVSPDAVEAVRRYVNSQEEHTRNIVGATNTSPSAGRQGSMWT